MSQSFTVLLSAIAALLIVSPQSRGQDAVDRAETPTDSNAFDEISKEFRELIVQQASDSDSSIQNMAISILRRRGYTDSRFDDMIRKAISIDEQTKQGPFGQLENAITLMPHSTLGESEQVKLLLGRLLLENERFVVESVYRHGIGIANFGSTHTRRLVARLSELNEELAVQLEPLLAVESPPAILCALAEVTDEFGEDLVPLLLQAARSGDRAVRLSAIASADKVLQRIERKQKDEARRRPRDNQTLSDPDDKLDVYAGRIIQRYDTNHDGTLTEAEWKSMLMSPVAADTDGDGSITAEEYTEYLRLRSKKKLP